jgi:hypothetical protein
MLGTNEFLGLRISLVVCLYSTGGLESVSVALFYLGLTLKITAMCITLSCNFSCILSTYLEQLTGSHIKLYRSEVNRLRHLCLQKLLVAIPDKYTVD